MKVRFTSALPQRATTLVLLVAEGTLLGQRGMTLDKALDGHISRAIAAGAFQAKRFASLDLVAPGREGLNRILLVGAGPLQTLGELEAELCGGTIAGLLQGLKVKEAHILVDFSAEACAPALVAARIASGARLRTYQFAGYKTKKPDPAPSLTAITLISDESAKAGKLFPHFDAVAEGVRVARDLVNEPANKLDPLVFSERAKELADLGVKIEVLNQRQMEKLGMGALLGVAQGSTKPPFLVVMQWLGGKTGEAPVAFVGKGVTFDSGGISIKQAAGMEDMKGDMAGAACVTGLMHTLARRKARVNVVGIIGLVENMPDGNAIRPSDVLTSLSGQTIAVLNTDAEGRLVLADALWYCQRRFKPKFMVNLATLTGAILVALGKEHAGLFSNDTALSDQLTGAGLATGEKVWRMPLNAEYDKLIDCDIADMKNTGGRNAGSITAGQFLQRFVNDVPWAHLDIAGTGMDAPKNAINQSWGSGWGVRLLDRLVSDHYEGQ